MYIGPSLARVTKGDTFTFKFTMTVADVPTTLTTPTVKAYEEGSNVEFTGGITLNVDYDGKTGLNELIIDTSDAAYTAGKNYDFFFSAGSIGAVTLVGTGFFHLALIPEPADLRAVNGGSTGDTAGKLELAQLKITATGSDDAISLISATGRTVKMVSTGSDTVYLSPGGTGKAINALGTVKITATGNDVGLDVSTVNGAAINAFATGTGIALNFTSDGNTAVLFDTGADFPALSILRSGGVDTTNPLVAVGVSGVGGSYDAVELWNGASGDSVGLRVHGMAIIDNGSGSNEDALQIEPSGAGKAINALGQVSIAPTNTDDSALVLTPNGDGLSIDAVVEGSVGIVESLMLANAANAGKTNGMGAAGTVHLRNLEDDANRITAVVDSDGNRTSVTLDLT